jgi:hypothetical protein
LSIDWGIAPISIRSRLTEAAFLWAVENLDSRNRYRAYEATGTEPVFTVYAGDDPAAYVVSLNIKRRHLDESQRAMVAAKLANLKAGQRSDLAHVSLLRL